MTEVDGQATVQLATTVGGRTDRGDGVPQLVFDGDPPLALQTDSTHRSHLSEGAKEALLSEEIARARGWAWIALVLAVGAGGFVPLLPLESEPRRMLLVSLVAFVAMSVVVLVRLRERAGYTKGLYRVWGYGSAVMSLPLQYGLGMFSPTPLIVTLGLIFFSLGLDRRHALWIPMTAIVCYVVVASLIVLGVLPDIGIAGGGTPLISQVFFIVFVPLVFLATVWFARVSRQAMRGAIAQAVEAQRVVGQREAQLFEAQQELEEALRAGAGFGGRYTGARVGVFHLGAVVGRGAMGEVYAANNEETGAPAAVKLLRGHAARVDALMQRFIREGRIAASLDSPNVVRVLDVGVVPDKGPYIAMELLDGDDLGARLRHTPQLDLDELVDLARQVGRGLDAAHDAGIVHRDLKPGNLFLHGAVGSEDEPPTWKIVDFGVSKLAGSEGTLTQGDVLGTPAYMAPEQARGLDADRRADVYALGAVLYRAVTGQAPFTGPDTPSILFDVVYRMPERPSALRRRLSRDVDRVLAMAMAKRPGDRFASAGDLAAAFEAAVTGRLPDSLAIAGDRLCERYPWGEMTGTPDSPEKAGEGRGRPDA